MNSSTTSRGRGDTAACRFRIGLEGDRLRWKSDDKLCLYGLEWLSDEDDELTLVEGESDCHTLWFYGVAALGLPGVANWLEDRDAERLARFSRINVTIEPDTGGEAVLQWLRTSSIRNRTWLVRLEAHKDVSELHKKEPGRFLDVWKAAVANAERWVDREVAEPRATAGGKLEGDLLKKLAALPPIAYDQQRKEAAKRLGIRESTLDGEIYQRRPRSEDDKSGGALFPEIEPWPDSVAGGELLDALIEHFRRFAVLPDEAAPILALWVLHAHAHDAASVSPILAVLSPEKRCGKTTVLTLVQALTPRALPTSNITSAALFRAVEEWGPTLLIDEADTFLRNNEELRGVLNSGHNRFTAYVVRTVGDDHTPAHFRTWAPKAIALIGLLPDTLADRAVTVALRRKRPDEQVERLRLDRMNEFESLRRQAARWAEDNLEALRVADPNVPFDLHDRAADNWRAMFAIADRAGGHWPDMARRVARAAAATSDLEDSARVMLLKDIRDIFEKRDIDRLTSVEIMGDLVEMEHRPWPEWKEVKPITARQIASLLKPFGISPATIRLTGEKTARGYNLTAFKESFLSYLPPIDPTQQHNPQETAPNDGFQSDTSDPNVLDRESPQPAASNGCVVVSDETSLPGDEGVLKENFDVKDYEDWEERAAILEYDGGLERNEAEQRAQRMVFDK